MTLNDNHRDYLVAHAVDPDLAVSLGVRSIETVEDTPACFAYLNGSGHPSLLFPWTDGSREWFQLRPDVPIRDAEGKEKKYVFPFEQSPLLWKVWDPAKPSGVLIVEGTKQALAVASTHIDWTVYAMAGCWGFVSKGKIPVPSLFRMAPSLDLVVIFDSDLSRNPQVWDAAKYMLDELPAVTQAKTLCVTKSVGGGTTGIDDVLGTLAESQRLDYVESLIANAKKKIGSRPKDRTVDSSGAAEFFDPFTGEFHPRTAALAMDAGAPFAYNVAGNLLYRYQADTGTYSPAPSLGPHVASLLGDLHASRHVPSVEHCAAVIADENGRLLDPMTTSRLIPVANGVLDPLTGELTPHSPDNILLDCWAVEWDPDATCPTIMSYLEYHYPYQVDAMLDTMARVLERERDQDRALFLFGDGRNGKGTVLYVLEEMVGPAARASETLHALAEDRWATAHLFGKALNVSADLDASDVGSSSIFKMLTGGDNLSAEFKFQQKFDFKNHALLAFSANSVPAMPTDSNAEMARFVPIYAGVTFLGHEDETIKPLLAKETPGLLVELVRRFQRMRATGEHPQPLPIVQREFHRRINRVQAFVEQMLEKQDPSLPHYKGTPVSEVYRAYKMWAEKGSYGTIGVGKFTARLPLSGYTVRRSDGMRVNATVRREADHPSEFTDWVEATFGDGPDDGGWSPSNPSNPRVPPVIGESKIILDTLDASTTVTRIREKKEEEIITSVVRGVEATNRSKMINGLGEWSYDLAVPSDDPYVALDTETTGLGAGLVVRTIQLGYLDATGNVRGVLIDLESDPDLVRDADRLLSSLEGRLYSFSGFDQKALEIDGRFTHHTVTDVAPASHLADPKRAKGGQKQQMKAWGLGHLVTPVTAEQTLAMATTDPAFCEYAMTDAMALRLLMTMWPVFETEWLTRENRIEQAARRMQAKGAQVDIPTLVEIRDRYLTEAAEAEVTVTEIDPDLKNVRSHPQVLAAYERRGVALPTKRRKKADGTIAFTPTTGHKDLKSDDPLVLAVQRAVGKKAAAKYVDGLIEAAHGDGRIHSRWNPLGATSSRWASSSPNLQNVAKHGEQVEIRSAFVPSPGKVFVQADLSQIEYRVAAALSGDVNMINAFETEGDLHIVAARVLAGRDEPTKKDRSDAKAIGFGKLYGSSIETSAKAAGVSEGAMAMRIDAYDAEFPRLAEWCNEVYRQTMENEESPVSPYGRSFPVPGAHAGVNYLCQSTARELFCDWFLALDEEFPDSLVLAIHDEVVLEVDPDRAEEVAARVAALANEANRDRPWPLTKVEIVAESAVAPDNWMQAYEEG